MKIGNFPLVARAVTARLELVKKREQGKVEVVIDGVYQDQAMIERVKPAVASELMLRIQELDEDLRQMGVVID